MVQGLPLPPRRVRACILTLSLASIVLAWIVIGLSWHLNSSWFVFTRDAFSDLGGSDSCCPGLYNYGLMVVGSLIVMLGSCIAIAARGRVEVIGASYIALAGVFLGLIGYYHSGTRPHTFVSLWFFIQMNAGLAFLGVGISKWARRLGLVVLAIAVAAFPIAGLVEAAAGWPSAAVLETYGIILIDVMVALSAIAYWRYCPPGPRDA